MRLHGTKSINSYGHLVIGGCDTVELAQEFGTPLLIIDESELRRRCRIFQQAFLGTGLSEETIYASKAFLNIALCKIFVEEGLGLDVVSGGELYIAQAANFPMEKVYFHGNNKTIKEIEMALELNVGRFVIDNLDELKMINFLASERKKKVDVLFRVTPGIEAHTHEYIQTGQLDSKFGSGISNGKALEMIKAAATLENIRIKGLHCHIGSQIFNLMSFAKAAEIMMDFIKQLSDELGILVKELNLGGGFGIPLTESESEVSIFRYAEIIESTLKKKADEFNLLLPKIILEPGRYLIGTTGTTIYTVGNLKEIPDLKTYVTVDGGMTDNIRPALYHAKYDALVANKADIRPNQTVTIAGRCCESGDILIENMQVPEVRPGDLIAIFSTGAYTYSMSSNYNGLPRIAVVLVNDGDADLIVRRETYEDLISRDLVPERLNTANTNNLIISK